MGWYKITLFYFFTCIIQERKRVATLFLPLYIYWEQTVWAHSFPPVYIYTGEKECGVHSFPPCMYTGTRECGLYIVWVHMAPAHICDTETIHYMYVIKSDFTI